jgi:drug/metabolite transporter (DMT)-like permease
MLETLAVITGLGSTFFYGLSAVFISKWGRAESVINVMYASIFFNFLASSALYVTLSRSFELRGFSILAVSGALVQG